MAEQGAGLVDQAKAKVAEVEGRIDRFRQQRFGVQAELAQLSAQLREQPGDVDLLQRADACRRSMEELDRQTPRRNYRPGDVRPRLQLELERARQDLEAVRRARWNLARSVAVVEALQLEWSDRLPRVLATVDDLLTVIGPGRFPPKHERAEVRLRALRAWALDTSNVVRGLEGLRSRLADYGDDDGWEPAEVRERGILGDRPESRTSKWYG